MKKIFEKASDEGWTYMDQSLCCGNRIEFTKDGKKIIITLNSAAYKLTNMSLEQMKMIMEADTLYTDNDPVVEKIRNLTFEEQTNLIGTERELFLLLCEEN